MVTIFLISDFENIKKVMKGGFWTVKPIIGLTANYSENDQVGAVTRLGLPNQKWQLLADDYIHAIEMAGGSPVILPVTIDVSNTERILSLLDGIIFTGGVSVGPHHYSETPKWGMGLLDVRRDEHEIGLAKKVLDEMDIPVLAICRGCQMINVASGGRLHQDIERYRPNSMNHYLFEYVPKYYKAHVCDIKKSSRLYKSFGTDKLETNSLHHQAVNEGFLGKGFEATMTAPDGIVEGMEMAGKRFVVAIQWHPEMMMEKYPEYVEIYRAFVEECTR